MFANEFGTLIVSNCELSTYFIVPNVEFLVQWVEDRDFELSKPVPHFPDNLYEIYIKNNLLKVDAYSYVPETAETFGATEAKVIAKSKWIQ